MSTHTNREMLKAVFLAERTADFEEDEEDEDEETGRDVAGPSGEVRLVLQWNAWTERGCVLVNEWYRQTDRRTDRQLSQACRLTWNSKKRYLFWGRKATSPRISGAQNGGLPEPYQAIFGVGFPLLIYINKP